jgi:hypothetical protein
MNDRDRGRAREGRRFFHTVINGAFGVNRLDRTVLGSKNRLPTQGLCGQLSEKEYLACNSWHVGSVSSDSKVALKATLFFTQIGFVRPQHWREKNRRSFITIGGAYGNERK